MDESRIRALRALAPVLFAFVLAACGGGGGGGSSGGGGGGGTSYSISVSPTTVALNALTNGPAVTQNVTVSFVGEGVIVGTLPGIAVPGWLSVGTVSQTTNSAVFSLNATTSGIPGTYPITLRFVTGKADGSSTVYTDVPVTFVLQAGQQVFTNVYGLATGSAVAVALNGGTQVALTPGQTQQNLIGTVLVGSTYSLTVPTQPGGQTCTFDNGSATISDTVSATAMQLRLSCNATLIPWTWFGGSKTFGDAAVYGTRGTAAAGNTPGGRSRSSSARDAAGNLWIFGGLDGSGTMHNDLWKYDTAAHQWTWINGPNTANGLGTFGTRGVAANSNVPGARNAAAAWFDGSGNFWLFGGSGFTTSSASQLDMNDLWMYSVANDTWTWVGGSNGSGALDASGVYDTTPATTNIPGGREQMIVARDATGAVWLFGGLGYGAQNSYGRMNDLWKFDPATLVWSWLSGSSTANAQQVQGTLGVAAASSNPGPRVGASAWVDGSGNLWMFGGANAVLGYDNDLWRFDSTSKLWTWMGGTDRSGGSATLAFGTYKAPASAGNYPAGRAEAATWTDASGNFWLFGGNGQTPGNNTFGAINDLWRYSPASNTWSWLSGTHDRSLSNGGSDALPSVYGTQGVAASTTVPGARIGAYGWIDATGHLWMWGGVSGLDGSRANGEAWFVTPP